MPDDVQPDEGQGDSGSGGSPYDSYLQDVPEQAREAAEAWFKDTSKGLDAKLQEAAALQKTWEPYKDALDPSLYPPEQLSELLAWHQQVTANPEVYQAWLKEQAEAAGLTPAQADALETAEQEGDLTREEVQKLIEEQAEQRVAPLRDELTQFQTEQAVNAEEGKIRSRIDELQKEHSVTLTEAQKADVFELGANDPNEDWVKVGFDRYMAIAANAQKAFVNDKAKAPAPPMTGGGGEQFKPTTSFKEAEGQARERLRQAQS